MIKIEDILITFLASFLIWVLYGGLIILWVVDGRVKREVAIHALMASFAAWIVSEVVKNLIPSMRPFQVNGLYPLTLTTPGDHSFPSSHASLVFGMAFAVWLHNKKLGWIFLFGAILVGTGRVLAHVHYIQDIIAGAFLGIASAYALERVHFKKYITSRKK